MRKILFALLLLVSASCMAQVPYELGAIKIDSVYFKGTSKWVDSLVTNYKLPYASDQQIPSAKAVKEFVADTVSQIIHDSISGLSFTSTALSDSIDKHTDTLQLHNTRLKAMELIDHTHPNKATLDATTASYTTAINSTVTNHTQYIADLNDSIARHTDSLQLHNTRLGELEAAIGGEILIDATLDAAADTFVTINNGSWGFTTSIVGSGTGDVNVSGTTAANTIAYWNGTDSTLVSNDVVKLYADSSVYTEPMRIHDSLYFKGYAPLTRYAYPYIDSLNGNVMKLDSTVLGAHYGLVMPFRTATETLADSLNGEIAHYLNVTDKVYAFDNLLPNQVNNILLSDLEMAFRQVSELEKQMRQRTLAFIGILICFGIIIILKRK